MAVLTIRAHRRYAVRQPVRLGRSDGEAARGLLIELSSEGLRISNLGRRDYAIGEEVTVEFGDFSLCGRIRWAHDGIAGVRLDQALYPNQIGELVARDRGFAEARVA
jgi:hypothetical protein